MLQLAAATSKVAPQSRMHFSRYYLLLSRRPACTTLLPPAAIAVLTAASLFSLLASPTQVKTLPRETGVDLREAAEDKEALAEIAELRRTVSQLSEEKVAAAQQAYDTVDLHIRRLDEDLRKYESELRNTGALAAVQEELGIGGGAMGMDYEGSEYGDEGDAYDYEVCTSTSELAPSLSLSLSLCCQFSQVSAPLANATYCAIATAAIQRSAPRWRRRVVGVRVNAHGFGCSCWPAAVVDEWRRASAVPEPGAGYKLEQWRVRASSSASGRRWSREREARCRWLFRNGAFASLRSADPGDAKPGAEITTPRSLGVRPVAIG